MWTLLTWPKGHSGNHWASPKNSALVGNNSMSLECVIYSFPGNFPPAFPALDSVKSASSFSWVHNALGQPTPTFTPSPSSSSRSLLWPKQSQSSTVTENQFSPALPGLMGLSLAYQHTHWHSYARCCSCRSYLLSGRASPQGLKHQGQRRASAGWKVQTAGLTVEDAGRLRFPPTFRWSGDNKGLSAVRKGESESLTHGWWGDVSWPVIKKMNHITKAPGTRKLPLLLFTPSHPTPSTLSPEKKRRLFQYMSLFITFSHLTHTKNTFCPDPPPWGSGHSEKVARCRCGETFFMNVCMPRIPPQTV